MTTNNKMELEAAIQGLKAARELHLEKTGEIIELVSDSQYTLGIANKSYCPTTNLEQAASLHDLATNVIKVRRYRWVRGHMGDKWNEICDKLAKQGKLENVPKELQELKKNKSRKRKQKQKENQDVIRNKNSN